MKAGAELEDRIWGAWVAQLGLVRIIQQAGGMERVGCFGSVFGS